MGLNDQKWVIVALERSRKQDEEFQKAALVKLDRIAELLETLVRATCMS